jgi:arylsulfatase
MVPGNAAPRLLNRPHSISVELDVPEGGAGGVLFSMGGNDGGFSIYVLEGVFTYGYNYVADSYFHVRATSPLPSGHHVLSVEFRPTGPADLAAGRGTPAHITLFVDGAPVGEGDLPVTIPLSLGLAAGVAVGHDPGSPAMPDYQPPFPWAGGIQRAMVDVSGTPVEDQAARIREVLARQ